jgi:hypothetical protein
MAVTPMAMAAPATSSHDEAERERGAAGLSLSQQRLDQHAMAVAADHEGWARRPVAVLIEAPWNLDALDGCAALAARWRRAGKEFRFIHLCGPRSVPFLGYTRDIRLSGRTVVQSPLDRRSSRAVESRQAEFAGIVVLNLG